LATASDEDKVGMDSFPIYNSILNLYKVLSAHLSSWRNLGTCSIHEIICFYAVVHAREAFQLVHRNWMAALEVVY
jgi:hypothetical protein